MSEYFKPKFGGLGSVSGLAPMASNMPETKLPAVGNKMLMVFGPYGANLVSDDMHITDGASYVEVEVTAIKKAKVTLE